MVFSLVYYFGPSVFDTSVFGTSVASRACAGKQRLIPSDETALFSLQLMFDAWRSSWPSWRLELKTRIGPRHPRLGAAGFGFARWLARLTMSPRDFISWVSPI
jgi:hypothetical protein